MQVLSFATKAEMARAAAAQAALGVREIIAQNGHARVIAATGASQFEFLDALVATPGMAWDKTVFFHLDEYVGLPETHPASFRRYLKQRIVERVHPGTFHFIAGDAPDPEAEALRVGELLSREPIDLRLTTNFLRINSADWGGRSIISGRSAPRFPVPPWFRKAS